VFLDDQRDGLGGERGEETAPVRVTRRKIAPLVMATCRAKARRARTGHGPGGST